NETIVRPSAPQESQRRLTGPHSGIMYTSNGNRGLSGQQVRAPMMSASADIVRDKRAERPEAVESPTRVAVDPLANAASLKRQAYTALKNAIAAMDVYRSRAEIRLDERRLAHDFGISRTPVREAMAQLEREGFVRSEPRRGV